MLLSLNVPVAVNCCVAPLADRWIRRRHRDRLQRRRRHRQREITVLRPVAAAVTVYGPPAIEFAVNGADAIPEAFVGTTIVAVLLLNAPVAPVAGAVNVTFTPETGLPPASFTVTAKGLVKAVLIFADCGVEPAFGVIVAGAPVIFVSEKFAGVHTPDTVAATMYPPSVPFAVNTVDVATPLPFVTAV